MIGSRLPHGFLPAASYFPRATPSEDLNSPRAHNQDLALPSVLIAMAHTRAQTAAQKGPQSPAPKDRGAYSLQR